MSTQRQPPATTGLPGLDAVLSGIEPGDNIVWEVDAIADYREFVSPYVAAAQAAGRHPADKHVRAPVGVATCAATRARP